MSVPITSNPTHLPEVQELIPQEIQKGTIRVRPNPDGSIRIDGDEGWRESRSLPLVHVPSVHVSKQPRGDIRPPNGSGERTTEIRGEPSQASLTREIR